MIDFNMKKIEEMTVKQKIGQLVMAGFPSTVYDEKVKKMVEDYCLGNILLFTRNYSGTKQMKELCKDLHKNIIKSCGVLPLIAIDQEGGTVTRMMKEVTFAPSAMTCAASAFKDASYESGRALARDMILLGMNIDFAPCLEINRDCMDNNHNVRSYGANPVSVAKHVKRFIDGMNEYGVLATAKHFPGSGDSTRDAHLELPVVESSVQRMWDVALYPFRENIDVPAVMTTHSLFKAYGDLPTTLSKNCLDDLLRGKLNYKGIAISDGLEMKAIADNYGIEEAALMCINAGIDIALICHDTDITCSVIERLYRAYDEGNLTMDTINDRVSRILKYKEKTIPYLEKYFNNNFVFEEDKEASAKMQEIVDKSLTLIKGELPSISEKTLILAPVASVASQAEDVFDERDLASELKKYYNNPIYKFEKNQEFVEMITKEANKYDDVVILSYDSHKDKYQIDAINNIIALKKEKAYVISLKGAMDGVIFKDLKNYMVLYEYTPNSIRTIFKYFKGEVKPMGKLPID